MDTVLNSMNITVKERTSYGTVMQKFDYFFRTHHNVIFERARFNQRSQTAHKSMEQYLMDLYYLKKAATMVN